ncbi:hypothetical protein [Flavobacterium noncentrifugens]|uniref:SMODS and SLOG-associating 2TM effector domain-containing protein n=1 Tax=Flavobacterium noncentrifugens TaxID=1128970 RepID=A0A1G9DDE9_9FLAO|nr:hypothetical protein [Flavobacterium noncentrifugens]SDK61922.1 hypothetical protein SAMN04487935_3792 [Flavobacterium noncentrifugens]
METNTIDQIQNDLLVQKIENHLYTWNKMANWLQASLIVMGFLSITSSLFVSAFAGILEPLAIQIIAFFATLFITLITAFNLPTKANNVRNGWRILNKAYYDYKNNSVDLSVLLKAYEDGEKVLDGIEFNFSKSKND